MADETPICKKCGTPKTILKGKRNQHYIGCPKCAGKPAAPDSSPEPGRTTSPPAPEVKPVPTPEKKTSKFWW